jgi:class I fructose-bisphosphate aldolase
MVLHKEIEKVISKKLSTDGKTLFLAQDQGLEHFAPNDLIGLSVNPDYIFEIAEKGKVDAFICQKGLAEKYADSYKTNILLKINGKTILGPKEDPYSPITCSVRRAVELGSKAIGFTLFPGSKYFLKQMDDFRIIQEEAHDFGLPVTAWMYPRGKEIKNDLDGELLQYCSRIGLELGADMLKMKYNGNPEDMKKMVTFAGKAKVLMAGGPKAKSTKEFLQQVKEVDLAGAHGFAIGRNIWQHEQPLAIIKAIRDIQKGKDVYSALKRLE